jgi:hypothetical protein
MTSGQNVKSPISPIWKPQEFERKVGPVLHRAISPNEVKVVNWLLDHALVDVTAYRLRPVEELRVVGSCGCGCTSLYFKPHEQRGKLLMLVDELAVYPDGQQAGLILWGHEGEIVWLEVYDFHPQSSHRVPDASNLCTWDELGRTALT